LSHRWVISCFLCPPFFVLPNGSQRFFHRYETVAISIQKPELIDDCIRPDSTATGDILLHRNLPIPVSIIFKEPSERAAPQYRRDVVIDSGLSERIGITRCLYRCLILRIDISTSLPLPSASTGLSCRTRSLSKA
jgi:hypothetical protein